MEGSRDKPPHVRDLSISFGYQCSIPNSSGISVAPDKSEPSGGQVDEKINMRTRSSSFSCLSGAAISANATLANTNICNGFIGAEILPNLDSPKSFRRMASSPSFSRLDLLSSSSHNSITTQVGSASTDNDFLDGEQNLCKSSTAPTRTESSSFLSAMDVQMAGGAAGEDRVQAVCSEENGWLFCGIYDGFNGRDAADFLTVTLYDNIGFHLQELEGHMKRVHGSTGSPFLDNDMSWSRVPGDIVLDAMDAEEEEGNSSHYIDDANEAFRSGVIGCLNNALAQAESNFMSMVEQEMEDRPDLVSVGSCVLAVLLHGSDLYVLNVGDSRAVLATNNIQKGAMKSIQLTETHTVDNKSERDKILADHPDDPSPIINGRVKGKLRLTRAFGVGYLKKSNMNDALMGILRVRNLFSPPYVYTHPSTLIHRVSENDQFVVLGSDGLFDFFSNDEVVRLVHLFIQHNPFGDPARYLVEQLIQRAASDAGFSTEELMMIPAGRRRKYHDDVTVIVILLGNKQRTSKASTSL